MVTLNPLLVVVLVMCLCLVRVSGGSTGVWGWVLYTVGLGGDSVVADEPGANDAAVPDTIEVDVADLDLGSYRLPWRPWQNPGVGGGGALATDDDKNSAAEKEQQKVLVILFERVGTYSVCKQRIADGLSSELQGRTVEQLDNEEQRALHTNIGLALTNCHLHEHGREIQGGELYRSADEMTTDDFALYTQFLLAVEDTLVSQLGHERWQRSVEQLVGTLSQQLQTASVDMRGLEKLTEATRVAQQEVRRGQDVSLIIQKETRVAQVASLVLQQEAREVQAYSVAIQNETLVKQQRVQELVESTARVGEAHFSRLHEAARAGEEQVHKLLLATQGVAIVAAQVGEQQGVLIRGQKEMEDVLSTAAATSQDIAEMMGGQHALLLEVQQQSNDLVGAWKPALDAVHAASTTGGFFDGLQVVLFYFLWATVLWLVPAVAKPYQLGGVANLVLVVSAGVECYAPVDKTTMAQARTVVSTASAIGLVVAMVVRALGLDRLLAEALEDHNLYALGCHTVNSSDHSPGGAQAFIDALLTDVGRGNSPRLVIDSCPALLDLLSEAPPGYLYDEEGDLVACDQGDYWG